MKQRRFVSSTPLSAIEATASLLVARSEIPGDLSESDRAILRKNLEPINTEHMFFFHDCAEVRRVLDIEE
jgi:hypothetical protein